MAFNINKARNFVKAVDLKGIPRGLLAQDAAAETGEVFDKAKSQAQVIGSGVFSFAQGVTAEVREAISDSALLAQLVANKQASVEQAPLEWFKAYTKVLQNVGWTLQEGGWTDYSTTATGVEVHEKIIEVMTVVLGPAAAALPIITATVAALKAMKSNSPWITIFSREAQKAKIARFQIGLVDKEQSGDVFVSMVAYLIEAKHEITQLLFFKFRSANASFKANSSKVSINRAAVTALGPAIRSKIRAYQADYLSGILNL
jgi:hypothetical protein